MRHHPYLKELNPPSQSTTQGKSYLTEKEKHDPKINKTTKHNQNPLSEISETHTVPLVRLLPEIAGRRSGSSKPYPSGCVNFCVCVCECVQYQCMKMRA